ISIITVILAYCNYRLNRILNIKNQLYNEKLKLYRKISKKIAELIFFIDKREDVLAKHLKGNDQSNNLLLIAEKIDSDVRGIEILMIEAHMLAPLTILSLMQEFTDCVYISYPEMHRKDVFEEYIEATNKLRNQGENLIEFFREDLRVAKLNKSIF
ncbi:MAG: hypothetical protein Q7W45_09720, partial [Bacteroidota bacterium]|nr:hypothetical protein [Bacteroidota bacterium]